MVHTNNAHWGIRHLFCKCEIREHSNVDPCKRRLKVASHLSLSCLLTLKPKSFSTEVLPEWIIVQFNTIENVMMIICVSHIDSLIVYEHLTDEEGEIQILEVLASKAVLLLWIIYVISGLFWYAFVHVCLLMPCGYLLGKGWPLGSRFWCLIVKLLLSHWYSGSSVVLDCIDSWSFPSFLLSNHVARDQKSNLGTRHYWTVTLKGALRYMFIGKFSCALYINGPLHCPYLSISTTVESCHANVTLHIVQTQMRCNQCGVSLVSAPFVNIRNFQSTTR